ncbi:MAG TPA: hypothetical protein PK635_01325 [Actinomycetota bacterium]|nr:hypothetical protein [Actinomycetota bacterium]
MRVFQTIVELVTAIAWPVTVGGIAFLFRREVREMLKTPLSRLKAGPIEAEWERTRIDLETSLAEVEQPSSSRTAADPRYTASPLINRRLEYLSVKAAANPAAVILDSYAIVEDVLREVLIARHVEGIERLNGIGLAARAVQSGVISPSTLESIQGVAVLRNLTAHGQAGDIDEVKARDYLSLVDGVIWTIRENSTRSQGR